MDQIKIQHEEKKSETGFGAIKEEGGDYRKATILHLQWLAERARKVERIKREIEAGNYKVDSRDIAKAMLNLK